MSYILTVEKKTFKRKMEFNTRKKKCVEYIFGFVIIYLQNIIHKCKLQSL